MFRCITELKGLAIDVDSFDEKDNINWHIWDGQYKYVFITSDEQMAEYLSEQYGEEKVFIEKYFRFFAPNNAMHSSILQKLQLKATEIAYLSKDIQFLQNAMSFLGGSIWITQEAAKYEDASRAPDLICKNLTNLQDFLSRGVEGFYGELTVFPEEDKIGEILPVKFRVDDMIIPLYMLGRYFGYSHYMNQLHPYSSAIYLNKKYGKKYYGSYDDTFTTIYKNTIKGILKNKKAIDGICTVPVRPGKTNRFSNIVKDICEKLKLDDFSEQLICVKDYPAQKILSQQEREENTKGVFKCISDLTGKNIIIIDDIVSTGSTMRECIRELKKAGANDIYIVALAVNQIQGTYWSSNEVGVKCPICSEKMHLLINGKSRQFFYACYKCKKTIDFSTGRKNLCEEVNNEFLCDEFVLYDDFC